MGGGEQVVQTQSSGEVLGLCRRRTGVYLRPISKALLRLGGRRGSQSRTLTLYVCSEDRFTNAITVAAEDFSLDQAITLSLSVSAPHHGERSVGAQQSNATDHHYRGSGKLVICFHASGFSLMRQGSLCFPGRSFVCCVAPTGSVSAATVS